MAWHRAASRSELAEGAVVGVEIEGTPVALYNLGGRIHATHGVCTHAYAMLADGFVEGDKIECPLHQGMFDIPTGKALCAPLLEDVRTYAVKIEGDDVLVDLSQPAAATAPAKVCATTSAALAPAPSGRASPQGW